VHKINAHIADRVYPSVRILLLDVKLYIVYFTIREVMEVRKNILEVIKEKRLRWFGHVKRMPGNRLPLKVLEWEPEGTRRRERPKERWIDGVRRSMTNHGLTEEDTRDRGRWRSLVLGEGKPP
jgi:hypothetical protein